MGAYAKFGNINLEIPRDLIKNGLKSDGDAKLNARVKVEIRKAVAVQNKIAHLISVYERIKDRVGP